MSLKDQIQALNDLYPEMTKNQIAQSLDCNLSTVHYHLGGTPYKVKKSRRERESRRRKKTSKNSPITNQITSDLLLEECITMCKSVLEHHGYQVVKVDTKNESTEQVNLTIS